MKRDYAIYILLLFLLLVSFIILWPNRWINLDIGDFHYHKLWEGPSLTKLSNNSINNDLNFELGKNFVLNQEAKVKINFSEEQEEKNKEEKTVILNRDIELLRNRFFGSTLYESEIQWNNFEDTYYLSIGSTKKEIEGESVQEVILSSGVLEFWGERDEPEPIEVGGDRTFSFTDYLKQNYQKLDVEVRNVLGTKTGKEEENYFLKVALQDDQSEKLSEEVSNYFGKGLVAVIDEKFLPIDGQDMGEQFQFYGRIRSVKVIGFQTGDEAVLYGSIVKNGPLELNYSIEEQIDIDPVYGRDFLKKGAIVYFIVLLVISILLPVFYKQDGFVSALSLILFNVFFVATLKVLPVTITMSYIYSICIVYSILIWSLFAFSRKSYYKKKANKYWSWLYVFDKRWKQKLMRIIAFLAVVNFIVLVGASWEWKNSSLVLLAGMFWLYIFADLLQALLYRLTSVFISNRNE